MFMSKRRHLRAEFGLPCQADARDIFEAEKLLLRELLRHLNKRANKAAQWGQVLAVKWVSVTPEYDSLD